jgi:branched-chain amino acid aminotransferase
MRRSAATLVLPVPSEASLTEMIVESVRANLEHVPEAPGSLYVRPTLLGTEANIGAAARATAEALLYVLTSPVGDYFEGGVRALKLAIETDRPRTTPQFGAVKSGANYAMALAATVDAQRAFDVDQVLFAPGGIVQETGASNFLLLDAERVVTPALSAAFLEGVTRASVLQIADDLGYEVEERVVTVDEVLAWARRDDAEAALSGTAAVMAGVGEIVSDGARITVGSGDVGPHTMAIRRALTEVHTAERPDTHGWLTPVTR